MRKLSSGFLGKFQGQLGTAHGCFPRLIDWLRGELWVREETRNNDGKPVEAWIYAAILLGIIGFALIFKKLIPNL